MSASPAALLSDLTVAENEAAVTREGVSIRPYPFPYIAALAVSNDCDGSTIETFEDWHGFVNGRGPTGYGDGLGLEIGDSFWVFAGGSTGLSLSAGLSDEPLVVSKGADRVVELGRLGWFDSLHSLGNWKQDYKSFRHDLGTRQDVERALDMLTRENLRPFVFTNHSWSPSNVAGPWGYYQKVDDPTHPMYAMDLLRDFGFRYFWPDSAVEFRKFGDQLRYASDDELQRAVAAHDQWPLLYKRTGLKDHRMIDLAPDIESQRSLFLAMFNRTILRVPAADRVTISAFKRFRGQWAADESSFALQVCASNLDALQSAGGAVIVYQHFGVTRDNPTGSAPQRLSKPPVLSSKSVEAWCDIARRSQAGKLFVTTTGRLLDYLCLAEHLAFHIAKTAERWTISLSSLDDSPFWSQRPAVELLNGLSFVVPADAPQVAVHDANGKALEFSRAADPTSPSKHAIYRPWQKLEWISVTSK
jgi:hypothetical protein